MRKNKLLLLLALLMTAATGAWATDYTTLAVGDVIKVGDTFSPTDDGAINDWGVDNGKTYTLIRADIDNEYNVTEKTDGAYYVFKYVSIMSSPYIHFDKAFEVTAISDGLEVTKIETVKGYLFYTLALHESAAAATYSVKMKDGVKDADKWTISPNPAPEGSPVTIQYTGRLKVKGVKATSDAPAEATPALCITSPSVGQVIGSDGKNYAYGSLPSGVTAVAKICYVSGSNGLALALTDEEGKKDWSTAQTACAAHTAPFTGGTWKLATKDEWSNMISAAGSYSALCDGFSSVGGTNMQSDDYYWSSTENGSDFAWYYDDYDQEDWDSGDKEYNLYVRACLAFTVEPAAPAANIVDLSTLTADYEAQNGDVLTGTLYGPTQPYKITIADGATVTLDGVTIKGKNDSNYEWAGLNCLGNATIVLKDGTENTVKGFHENYPGILVPAGSKLTIKGGTEGTGKLMASPCDGGTDDSYGAGIGGGFDIPCGDIDIQGGVITATGGCYAAGIGGGTEAGCGNITITGGDITATGGQAAAGIGSGYDNTCGNITIASTVKKVTATKGEYAPYSIGAGTDGSCGTVTIGGTKYWENNAAVNGGDTYLGQATIIYPEP